MTEYSAISSASRVQLLNLLQQRGERSIDELTEATNLHPNTVREHLQRLIEGGYAVSATEHRTTRGRPRVLYSATDESHHSGVAERRAKEAAKRGDLLRRVLPMPESELPDDAMHQLDALVDDLMEAGFDPAVDEQKLRVDLTPCQHADDAPADRAVLCSVHLKLMDGVLGSAGGPLAVEGMMPACDPTVCVVQLIPRRAG